MSFAVWAGTKKVTGGALIAKLGRDNALFLSLFPQIADLPEKRGNYDMKNPIHLKLTDDELGGILRSIRTEGTTSFYHTFDGAVTTGSFRYYKVGEGKETKQGFGLSVTKGEKTVKVGFSLGAAERFSEYIKYCLNYAFQGSHAEDIEKEKEYQEKVKASQQKPKTEAKPKAKVKEEKVEEKPAEVEPDPAEDDGDIEF